MVVAGMSVFLMAGRFDPVTLAHPGPGVFVSAALALFVLAAIHWYLFRHYTTIQIPVLQATGPDSDFVDRNARDLKESNLTDRFKTKEDGMVRTGAPSWKTRTNKTCLHRLNSISAPVRETWH